MEAGGGALAHPRGVAVRISTAVGAATAPTAGSSSAPSACPSCSSGTLAAARTPAATNAGSDDSAFW